MRVFCLTFNMFMENTYLLADADGTCAIVDPGCLFAEEQAQLQAFITEQGLKPVLLLNTHCHLDHVFGNAWVDRTYGLQPWLHRSEEIILQRMQQTAAMYGVPHVEPSPTPAGYLKEGEPLRIGTLELELRLAPGHSPGSLILHHAASAQAVVGDVIFQRSIGRTDLPGGSYETLMLSIFQQVLTLPGHTVLFPGHGPTTTVDEERQFNPFLQ